MKKYIVVFVFEKEGKTESVKIHTLYNFLSFQMWVITKGYTISHYFRIKLKK